MEHQMLPDTPASEEELEEESMRNTMRNIMKSVPDLNVMRNGSILVSSHGPWSIGLGDMSLGALLKIGYQC